MEYSVHVGGKGIAFSRTLNLLNFSVWATKFTCSVVPNSYVASFEILRNSSLF